MGMVRQLSTIYIIPKHQAENKWLIQSAKMGKCALSKVLILNDHFPFPRKNNAQPGWITCTLEMLCLM